MEIKFNLSKEKPLLLFSPLDWGLGHTTRCIPLIKKFLNLSCKVIVACNPMQKAILEKEFSTLEFVQLEGYDFSFGKTRQSTFYKIIFQIPKMLIRIKGENAWLRAFLQNNSIDAIISDNRYGFYSPKIPSVIITHQLSIRSNLGRWMDKLLQRFLYNRLNKFSVCWIPDFEGKNAIAGRLSNPSRKPGLPVIYLGAISRFIDCNNLVESIPLLILLSGPEPQRSIFEKKLLYELEINHLQAVMIRGLPIGEHPMKHVRGVTMYNHIAATELNQLICKADIIISRSGYTTIMDGMKLRKKMILVPTPGQTEQEYLAASLHEKNFAFSVRQNQFFLKDVLQQANAFSYKHIDSAMNDYESVLQDFVETL